MNDKQFLFWIYKRLYEVHNNKENLDFMHRLKSIILKTSDSQTTPIVFDNKTIEELDQIVNGIEQNNIKHEPYGLKITKNHVKYEQCSGSGIEKL